MEEDRAPAKLTARSWAYLPDLVILPLGVFLGAVGMCPGPYNKSDAAAMLGLGILGPISALGGGLRLIRGIRRGVHPLRILGALSLGSAALVGVVGWIYSSAIRDYIHNVLHRGH
jgi:hypothetical protein